MFYDDATGHRRALRRGEDVPADFPEVSLLGARGTVSGDSGEVPDHLQGGPKI